MTICVILPCNTDSIQQYCCEHTKKNSWMRLHFHRPKNAFDLYSQFLDCKFHFFFFNSHQANFQQLISLSSPPRHDERVGYFLHWAEQKRGGKRICNFVPCSHLSRWICSRGWHFLSRTASGHAVRMHHAPVQSAWEMHVLNFTFCESTKLLFGFLIIVECNFKYIIHRSCTRELSLWRCFMKLHCGWKGLVCGVIKTLVRRNDVNFSGLIYMASSRRRYIIYEVFAGDVGVRERESCEIIILFEKLARHTPHTENINVCCIDDE